MLMDRFMEMADTINIVNAMIAAGIALAIGVIIFIKRHAGNAK